MEDAARDTLERTARAACERGDFDEAATVAVRGYGPEVLGFLIAVRRDADEANDSFSEVSECLWKAMPAFAWNSTLRTWTYGIARNVLRTRRRNEARRERRAPRTGESALDFVVEQVRTATLTFLRTEQRSRLEALRDALPPEERMLLVLRVDRNLPWRDLAMILGGEEGAVGEEELAREAARLRKRFQLVKDRLRELARKEGIVE